MERALYFGLFFALACGAESEATQCGPDADYSVCGSLLPEPEPGQEDDDPVALYRTLSEAVTQVCNPSVPGAAHWIRGQCADGKTFLMPTPGAGLLLEVDTYYYADERMVGVSVITDYAWRGLCPSEYFLGSLESVRCDAPQAEPLCPGGAADAVPNLEIPFADGKPLHPCADLFGNRVTR